MKNVIMTDVPAILHKAIPALADTPDGWRQNILLILHGLYDEPFKVLITTRDPEMTERLYDCDGGYAYWDDGSPVEAAPETFLRDTVLQLGTTKPDEMGSRLKAFFGNGNVWIIPAKGYIAGKLIGPAGISAIVSFDCD